MALPVSMEDTELFPKTRELDSRPGSTPLDLNVIRQMRKALARLWWSRLVISVRGVVINYVQSDEMTLFHSDDAFIAIHRFLAEEKTDETAAEKFLLDLSQIVSFPLASETLLALSRGAGPVDNPFQTEGYMDSFKRVFGEPNAATYNVAEGQKHAYFSFLRVLCILQERWRADSEKKKAIRFKTDPEWQPDERVVLFTELYSGNRTYVLLDFDRYILAQWRPNGSSVIFGDNFVEKKQRLGMKLCSYCGMIEQQKNQFPNINGIYYCSPECSKGETTTENK